PDQLGQLLRHKGTSYGTSPGVRSPPIGGGLGSWVPTSPSTHSASRTQKSFPILISSPAVLFSELELAPGESQTFSIRVQLPKALPPSFRGRVACVSYDLVVVAKRNMLEANAHIVRIPFRVLAHVSSQQPVALSFNQPIRMPPESIQLTFQETAPVSTPRNASPSLEIDDDGLPYLLSESDTAGEGSLELDDQSAVIESLYEQLTGSTVLRRCIELVEQERGSPGASPVLVPSDDGEHAGADMSGRSRSDVEDGVMASIDDVCRRRAPVEFSLSQSGQAVASVWLPKRAYRLGDMVAGTVRLHTGRPGIYQVSIWLESVETINDQFSSYDGERNEELTRKVVADHHQFCRYNRTLGFALACPPTAAASFGSDIMSNVWQLRIELIIARPASLVSDLALSATAPFPPPRLQRTGTPAASRNGALRIQSPPSTPTSPTRLSSLPAAAQGRQFRTRSSTMAEGSIRPPILSPAAEQPRSSFVDDRQLAEPAAVKYGPLRRRYDAVAEVPVQTLSCTVTIQMYPPPSKELIPGHRDSHLIDLARRT
ncbi:Golgi membrane exchange factor (Ric1p-Rgp1p) subunit, partial [Coemansia sp. RSA 2610]